MVQPHVIGHIYEKFLSERVYIEDGRVRFESTSEAVESNGVVPMPKDITDAIVANALRDVSYPCKVTDVCCGSGNFLLSSYEHLVSKELTRAVSEGDAESLRLRGRAQRGRELLDRAPGRHHLAEDSAVLFPEGYGNSLVPALLPIEENVAQEDPHLAHVDFIDERVEGEVHRLHRIHGIGERTLPMGRHVHARIGDRRLYDAEGGERAARIKHRRDTRGRELVPLMVEAHGDDSASTIASHVEKTVRVLG